MTHQPGRTMRYILSAGRTGTVFLEQLMNKQLDGVAAVHEPRQSRYQMMLANLRNDWGIGEAVLKRWFEYSRRHRANSAEGTYIEVNPFLCPMTDLLPKPGHSLRIVHMVRDPAAWAASIVTFKASARLRNLIDYIPLAKPYPTPRPAGWRAMNAYERALWRWNWCNGRIGELQALSDAYALVRYEDLFSPDERLRTNALHVIGTTLGLQEPLKAGAEIIKMRVNPSPAQTPPADMESARRICGKLASAYGYDY